MRAEQRRRRLAEAAMRVMKRDGMRAATTRAITAEADMPHGAFHYCFNSKHELIREIFQADADSALAAAVATLDESIAERADLRACLRRALAAFWSQTVADREGQVVLAELSSLALREEALREVRTGQVEVYVTRLGEGLELLSRRTGTVWTVEARVLGAFVVSAPMGITESWLALGDEADPKGQLELLADGVVRQARPGS